MAWAQMQVSETNVILLFFGLFMAIFMLTSKLTQSKLHIGAANIAFIAGIVFGPRAASLLDPLHWQNVDTVVIEATRIVLVAQCFANGVELPKYYLWKHWRSLTWILGPAMVCGWLVCTCCVKLMVPSLDWRQSLACAACFNAIDPILAATALQTGSFYRRVPLHLRDLLRAEAGFNGLTTTLVLDFAIYLLRYRHSSKQVATTTLTLGLAYDVALAAVIGAPIGFAARRMLWTFEAKDWVDRPAFLSLYLAMSVFCAGVGSIVGTDEVLLAFIAGYCLDYDDRYQKFTKEAKISETIDLLLNLTYFVFIGSIIPWSSFDSLVLNIQPWRMVTGTLLIFLFRRIPIFTLLKSMIPDLETFREAYFYAHFGPIGGGAIFAALLIRAQLTPGSSKSASEPAADRTTELFLERLWAVTTFVFVCSSVVHGSSIAMFMFGKKLNQFEITQRTDSVYDPEQEPVPRNKSNELLLSASFDEESASISNGSPSRRSRRRNAEALDTILHDLKDGHQIIVRDEQGQTVKEFTIRRPHRTARRATATSLTESMIDRGHWTRRSSAGSAEQPRPSITLTPPSRDNINDFVNLSSGQRIQNNKGKAVER